VKATTSLLCFCSLQCFETLAEFVVPYSPLFEFTDFGANLSPTNHSRFMFEFAFAPPTFLCCFESEIGLFSEFLEPKTSHDSMVIANWLARSVFFIVVFRM
jgi:hypothetical protein